MNKARFVQAMIILLLIIGGWVGCSRIQGREKGKAVIRWVPAGSPVTEAELKPAAQKSTPAPESIKPVSESELLRAMQAMAESCRVVPGPSAAPLPEKKPEIKWPAAGPEIITAMLGLLDGMDREGFGFRVNDLVIGKFFDDGQNLQKGKLDAIRRYLGFLDGQARPKSRASVAGVQSAIVNGDLNKWWFTSAEKTLGQGMAAMDQVAADMKSGAVKIPGDPETLKKVIELTTDMLAAEQKKLTASEVGFSEGDNLLYHAGGVAAAAGEVVGACEDSFGEALKAARGLADLKEARKWLSTAAEIDPLIVLRGGPGDLRSNHLLMMAFALDQAEVSLTRAGNRM